MTKKPALGRGLSALIPGKDDRAREGVREADLSQLRPSRFQPRTDFDEKALSELAQSIRANGLVQPIVVAPAPDGGFTILAGERRFRAARQAGLSRVPVVVRPVPTDAERLELALVENLQREDLNPMEEAGAFGRLREEFHLTQEKIAERVGKERSSVANSLRLLKLPQDVRDLVRSGEISAGHAKAILSLSRPDDQSALAREIIRRSLSVRQAEVRAAGMGEKAPKVVREKRRDPFTRDAEEKLSRRLHARVALHRRRRGGTIAIEFSSEEDLIRLFELLIAKG